MSPIPAIVLAICCVLGWLKWQRSDKESREAFISFVGMFGYVIVGVGGIYSAAIVCSQIYGSFFK